VALGLRATRGPWREARSSLEVRAGTGFGSDYDALWERAGSSYAMCVRRDAAYLRWKYRERPGRSYEILELRREGRLEGFSVHRTEDYQGLRLGWIVDLFTEASDDEARSALLGALVAAFRRARVARAQAFCMNGGLARSLRRAGFFSDRSRALLCVHVKDPLAGPLDTQEKWHLVFGDGDMDR
jgi:hypothetical protein